MTMDFERARFNMIEQQIKPWQVLEPAVEKQLFMVKREDFVPPAYRNLAFADTQIPLGHGASMLSPGVEARMLQALQLRPSDRVLEIGTGSGYMAALLAARVRHVDSVEIVPELADMARANLRRARIENVSVITGNGLDPQLLEESYHAIVISGSLPMLPPHLTAHLKIGGRMVAIIGEDIAMEVQRIVRDSEASCTVTALFETVAPALQDAPRPSSFTL